MSKTIRTPATPDDFDITGLFYRVDENSVVTRRPLSRVGTDSVVSSADMPYQMDDFSISTRSMVGEELVSGRFLDLSDSLHAVPVPVYQYE